MNRTCKELIKAAKKARNFSYSPYSKFKVGAAIMAGSGKIYAACNIENASYGLTICAERAAICKMISAGDRVIKAIAVGSGTKVISPCGACRQFIIEFGKDCEVIMFSSNGKVKIKKIKQLLPESFEFQK